MRVEFADVSAGRSGVDMALSGRSTDPRDLILAAFAAARASGKKDWREMTTPVLKNRLLKLTDGSFDESVHTTNGMRGLVELYPDLLELDRTGPYPVARLLWRGDVADHRASLPFEVVPDDWRRKVTSRSTDPQLLSALVDGRTVYIDAEWSSDESRTTRRRLSDAMRRRSMRLRSGDVKKAGRSGTLLWAEER